MLMALGGLFMLVGFICFIIVVIDAFKKEIWKGVLSLLCFIYTIYYGFTEFQHEKKMMILGGMIGGYVLGYACYFMGAAAAVAAAGAGAH
jgi:benzodiazapine receptor